MRNKTYLLLTLVALICSCSQDKGTDKYDLILAQYEGEYQVESMEFTSEEGKTMVVDLNNDKKASNELLSELIVLHSGASRMGTKFFPSYGKRAGTLDVMIPVMDYYVSYGYYDWSVSPSIHCFLDVSINEDGSLTSSTLDHLEWPDEERIGMKAFGGVSLKNAEPGRIDLSVERYMVYDYKTSKEMIGKVSVILSRYYSEQ